MQPNVLMLLLSVGWAGAGLAQTPSPLASAAEPTATCVVAAKTGADRAACVGRAADACLAAVKGATEVDAAVCLNTEAEWWAAQMEPAYAAAQERAVKLDRIFAKAIKQGAPRMTDDLALMQTAWKDWSEKRCILEAMRSRGKLDRTVKASTCMLRVTADQVLLLQAVAANER